MSVWRDPEVLHFLELTTNYVVAAEAMIEGLQGKLGVDVKSRDQAVVEVKRRTDIYIEARSALIGYAREKEAAL